MVFDLKKKISTKFQETNLYLFVTQCFLNYFQDHWWGTVRARHRRRLRADRASMHGVHAPDMRGHRVCAPAEYPASGHEGTLGSGPL